MRFATYFEWQVRPGHEAAFISSWEAATRDLLAHGSGGSALFRTPDGHFAALARWPDRARRDQAFAAVDFGPQARALGDAVAQTVHRIDLEGVSDLWTWPGR